MRDSVSNGGANSDSDSTRARHGEEKKEKQRTVEMDGERAGKTGWERERGREREEGECEWRRGGQECGRNSHK